MLLADAAISMVSKRSGTEVSDRFRRATVVTGIVAANLPDLDILYAGAPLRMGSLGYLLHHRGYSHTILWAIVGGVILWALAGWWYKRGKSVDQCQWFAAHGSRAILLLALAGTLSHVALDFTNSYGVHPFWPVNDKWYYGDAMFIVEPWLWLVAIPALLWKPRALLGRIILSVLLVAILVAAWRVGAVAKPVAVAMTVFSAVWLAIQLGIPDRLRTPSGLIAWSMVTLAFFVASGAAKAAVAESVRLSLPREEVGAPLPGTLKDAVLNPAIGDPTCWSLIAVSTDGIFYRLSTGTVAPFPSLRTAAACRKMYEGLSFRGDELSSVPGASLAVPFDSSASVKWGKTLAVPRSEMIAFANERCEFVGALRFMRTPVWIEAATGDLTVSDLRFGSGGFATVKLRGWPHDCTLTNSWVPPWVPPRLDMLLGN